MKEGFWCGVFGCLGGPLVFWQDVMVVGRGCLLKKKKRGSGQGTPPPPQFSPKGHFKGIEGTGLVHHRLDLHAERRAAVLLFSTVYV